MAEPGAASRYWRQNLRYVALLLALWFSVSFLCGIVFVDELDRYHFAGFKLGFWFAQQGAIYVFVVLVFAYIFLMNRLERSLEGESKGESDSPDSGEQR